MTVVNSLVIIQQNILSNNWDRQLRFLLLKHPKLFDKNCTTTQFDNKYFFTTNWVVVHVICHTTGLSHMQVVVQLCVINASYRITG